MRITVDMTLGFLPCYSKADLLSLYPEGWCEPDSLARDERVPVVDRWWLLIRCLAEGGPWAVVAWCETWRHTYARAHADAHTYARAHTYAHAYARAHARAYAQARARARAQAYARAYAQAYAHAHALAYADADADDAYAAACTHAAAVLRLL